LATYKGTGAQVYLVSGTSVLTAGLAMVAADASNTHYYIGSGSYYGSRFADLSKAYTVKKDGSANTGYSRIVAAGTHVFFDSAQTGNWSIDDYSFPITTIAEGREWEITIEQDTADTTVFGATWKRATPTLKSGSGAISRWWSDDTLGELLRTGATMGVSLQIATNKTINAFVMLTEDSVKAAVDGMVEESLNFTVLGEVGINML
jgi:hypothetical protein